MRRISGFLGLVIVVAIGAYIYSRQAQSASGGASSPEAAIDIVGVKGDLLAIADAEITHYAQQSKYVSVEELRSAGDLIMPRNRRGPYSYSAEISDSGFRIVATYSGPPDPKMPPAISIDQTKHFTE
jgi:hypothetical protein